jgi:hypothetical protein
MTKPSSEPKVPGFFRLTRWRPIDHEASKEIRARWTTTLAAQDIPSHEVVKDGLVALFRGGVDARDE